MIHDHSEYVQRLASFLRRYWRENSTWWENSTFCKSCETVVLFLPHITI